MEDSMIMEDSIEHSMTVGDSMIDILKSAVNDPKSSKAGYVFIKSLLNLLESVVKNPKSDEKLLLNCATEVIKIIKLRPDNSDIINKCFDNLEKIVNSQIFSNKDTLLICAKGFGEIMNGNLNNSRITIRCLNNFIKIINNMRHMELLRECLKESKMIIDANLRNSEILNIFLDGSNDLLNKYDGDGIHCCELLKFCICELNEIVKANLKNSKIINKSVDILSKVINYSLKEKKDLYGYEFIEECSNILEKIMNKGDNLSLKTKCESIFEKISKANQENLKNDNQDNLKNSRGNFCELEKVDNPKSSIISSKVNVDNDSAKDYHRISDDIQPQWTLITPREVGDNSTQTVII